MTKTIPVVYRLDNINADDGVDLFEIAPILMSFGELIKAGNSVLGYDQKIDIKVRPFKEGSWIAEFVLQNQIVRDLLTALSSKDGQDLMLILAFLGLNAKEGITGVANIIRFTKGKVSNFKKSNGSKVTYYNDKGEHIEVTLPEHQLVQSPVVQINYYNGVISPLDKFPTAGSVSISTQDGNNKSIFTDEDKSSFQTYAQTELLEDVEEDAIPMNGVMIKPKRGSYTGEVKAYSFFLGDSVLYPTTIEDSSFLEKLKSGDVRLFHDDILKVDLEIRQKKDYTNKIINHYAITKVIDYIEFKKPEQLNLNDF